ncbi:MAG: PASTA domain-containing protein [Lachnospiraceae bacterium]|nr:PASTA domain-containing protein [Lachnospiraceae bacterium]
MAEFTRCIACMKDTNGNDICPHCGFDKTKYKQNPRGLRLGMKLHDRFVMGKVLGEGGFGITYIGWDELLEMPVAIKEYFPTGLATREMTGSLTDDIHVFEGKKEETYKNGLKKFIREAKTLSKFNELNGIVSVRDFFTLNNTAYIVMDYINGITIKKYITENGKLNSEFVFKLIKPVMHSLEYVHNEAIVHRDISPDNIMISNKGNVKLIDFGAAREVNTDDNKSLTVMLKRGFAPEEQYRSSSNQGPWTDVYALCATIYYMITGVVPVESIARLAEDTFEPISQMGIEIDPEKEKALMKGLEVLAKNRYKSMKELYKAIYGEDIIVRGDESDIDKLIAMENKTNKNVGKKNINAQSKTLNSRSIKENVVISSSGEETVLMDEGSEETVLMDEGSEETVLMDEGSEETVLMNENSVGVMPSNYNASESVLRDAGTENKSYGKKAINYVPKESKEQSIQNNYVENSAPQSMAPVSRNIEDNTNRESGKKGKVFVIAGLIVVVLVVTALLLKNKPGDSNSTDNSSVTESSVNSSDNEVVDSASSSGEVEDSSSATEEIQILVPDVSEVGIDKAKELIKAEGLTVGEIKKSYSKKIDKGDVISLDPEAGSSVGEGTAINLEVSKGEELFEVPNVKNTNLDKAKEKIKKHFKIKVSYEYSSSVGSGKVISSSPGAGKKCKKKTEIKVVVSKGAKPVATTDYSSGNSSSSGYSGSSYSGSGSSGSSSGSSNSGSSGSSGNSGSSGSGGSSGGKKDFDLTTW